MTKDITMSVLLLMFAIMLDGAQVLIGLGITGITSVANLIPFVGQGISMTGSMLGAVIDVCLSFSFGSVLICLLGLSGMFYPITWFAGGIAEVIPFMDIFPGWTVMVARCIWKKHFEIKKVLSVAEGIAMGAALEGAGATARAGTPASKSAANDNKQSDSSKGAKIHVSKQMDDIRAKTKPSYA